MKNFSKFLTLPRRVKISILIKYVLFQIPDLLLLILVLLILKRLIHISWGIFWSLPPLWIVKDVILFPFLWNAYADMISLTNDPLIGAEGVVMEKCKSSSFVLVRGELWQARVNKEKSLINKGDRILVTGRTGLVLQIIPKRP